MAYSLLTAQQDDIICPLTHYSLIEIAGTDAEKYLQGQLTCDVTNSAIELKVLIEQMREQIQNLE